MRIVTRVDKRYSVAKEAIVLHVQHSEINLSRAVNRMQKIREIGKLINIILLIRIMRKKGDRFEPEYRLIIKGVNVSSRQSRKRPFVKRGRDKGMGR